MTDYRDLEGCYDRIVSIEMLEAVGEVYWPIYFKTLHNRLNAGGIAVLQVITIDEARFDTYRGSADFIQRHIFPGGMLPTKAIIVELSARAGLKLVSTQSFGQSYAATLSEWRKRFLASWGIVLGLLRSNQVVWRIQDYRGASRSPFRSSGMVNTTFSPRGE